MRKSSRGRGPSFQIALLKAGRSGGTWVGEVGVAHGRWEALAAAAFLGPPLEGLPGTIITVSAVTMLV